MREHAHLCSSARLADFAGYDEAHSRMLLTGFREWLITQAGGLDNHVWWSLVAHLTEPIGPKPIREMEPELDARAVNTGHDGLRRIYVAYDQWRQAATLP